MVILGFKGALKFLDSLGKCRLVRIVSSAQLLAFLPLFLGLFFFLLAFLEALLDLLGLCLQGLLPVFIKLLLAPFHLLVVLDCRCKFTHVLPEGLIFKCKFVNFVAVLVDLVGHGLVAGEEVQLGLDPVVFLVQEVDLVLELDHHFLVCFLMIFEIELVQVLPALVELAESYNLVVARFDLCLDLFKLLFELQVRL